MTGIAPVDRAGAAAVPPELRQRVLGVIDDDEIVRLAQDLIRIPSFTTEETPCAEWLANYLADQGFEILATQGTAEVLRRNGIDARIVRKHYEGAGPDGEPTIVQLILDGEIDLIVNTPAGSTSGSMARTDGYEIRTAAVLANIPCITTVQGLGAAVQGIEAQRAGDIGVRSLQDWAAR